MYNKYSFFLFCLSLLLVLLLLFKFRFGLLADNHVMPRSKAAVASDDASILKAIVCFFCFVFFLGGGDDRAVTNYEIMLK